MHDSKSCERVRERLFQFVDGDLSSLEQALDQGHMECCVPCAAERDGLLALMGEARDAMAPGAEELAAELEALGPRLAGARLRPAALRLLSRRATISLLTAAAAVLLLMALERGGEGLSYLGRGDFFQSLGVAEWRLPLGEGLLEAK